jgi:putative photosynthetic complex assembly protein 2
MSQIAIPVAVALLVWWAGTGIILFAIGRSRRTYATSLIVAGGILAASLWALADSRDAGAPWDAYVAFTGAVGVWAFVELTFLTGAITGPRTTPCPSNTGGWRRARYATETIIYHELALVAAGAAIVAATWNGTNHVAVATFAILWIMRLSSKLNLFLGVRTLNDELLPRQLQHLRSYFVRKDMNWLYPVSIMGSGAAAVLLIVRALSPEATEYEMAAFLLLASMLVLAFIEHAFMMIPMPIARLWGMHPRPQPAPAKDHTFNGANPSQIKPT